MFSQPFVILQGHPIEEHRELLLKKKPNRHASLDVLSRPTINMKLWKRRQFSVPAVNTAEIRLRSERKEREKKWNKWFSARALDSSVFRDRRPTPSAMFVLVLRREERGRRTRGTGGVGVNVENRTRPTVRCFEYVVRNNTFLVFRGLR